MALALRDRHVETCTGNRKILTQCKSDNLLRKKYTDQSEGWACSTHGKHEGFTQNLNRRDHFGDASVHKGIILILIVRKGNLYL